MWIERRRRENQLTFPLKKKTAVLRKKASRLEYPIKKRRLGFEAAGFGSGRKRSGRVVLIHR